MKHLRTLVGLLLIGLLSQNGLADISLSLRNGRGRGGQPYLPPTSQNAPRTEEYVQIREGSSGAQQQNFEESNYANSRYQIFEVHNHYEPSSGGVSQQKQSAQGNDDITHSNYEAQGYLPPHQEIHIQHVNDAPGDIDDNLDVSYLSFAAAEGLDGQQITIAEHVPSAPTPTDASVPVPFPSNFQHDIPKNNRRPAVATQEIHVEHHEIPSQQNEVRVQDARQTNYRGSDYLPPHESEHISSAPAVSEYRASDYLPPHREEHVSIQHQHHQEQQHQQQHPVPSAVQHQQHQQQQRPQPVNVGQSHYKGPDYLPPRETPTHETTAVRGGSNFRSQNRQTHTTTASQEKREFQAQGYLPPSHSEQHHHINVQQPTYQQHQEVQTIQQQQQPEHHQHVSQSNYKGPDYLPPHKGIANQPQQQQQPQQHVADTSYKGPDYLPPHTQVVQPQNPHQQNYNAAAAPANVAPDHNAYKGPDYLPPQHSSAVSHETRYSEPHTEAVIDAAVPTGPVSEYRASGYLPPGYDFVNPEEKQPEVITHHEPKIYQQHPQQALHHASVAQTQTATHAAGSSYRAPGFLPTGYEINKPDGAEQAIAQLHSHEQPRQSQSVQQYQQQTHVQIATLQQQQHQEVVVQSHIQVAGREQGSDIVYGRAKEQQRPQHPQQQHIAEVQRSSFQGNAYLPPAPATPVAVAQQQQPRQNYQAQPGHVHIQQSQQYQQQYQQPQQQQPQQQQQQQPQQQQPQQQQPQQQQPHYTKQVAPQFFPTEEPVQQFIAPTVRPVALGVAPPSYMHTLSSYMTSVQPFTRYGAAQFTEPRRPFAEYGPPRPRATSAPFLPSQPLATHQQQQQQQQTLEVAPMYREQATRPQYYAPSMSYTGYSASSSLLSAQAKQSLQKFMPREIQQQIVAAAAASPVPQATAGKIRTVQIVNPTAVKTLKVLETSDHAGVKTIKILGTSNEDPMGEHRIVKVVSQNGHNGQESHVQTVKIFNDHKDVVIPAAVAAPAATPVAAVAVVGHSYQPLQQQQQQKHKQHNSSQNRNAYLPPPAPRKQRSAQQQKRKQRPIIAGKVHRSRY